MGGDGVTDPAPLFPWFPLTSARLLFPDSVEDELELSAVRHRPEGLEQLESQTRFSRKELQILYRGFKNVRDLCLFSSCNNSRLERSRCSRFTLEKLNGTEDRRGIRSPSSLERRVWSGPISLLPLERE